MALMLLAFWSRKYVTSQRAIHGMGSSCSNPRDPTNSVVNKLKRARFNAYKGETPYMKPT